MSEMVTFFFPISTSVSLATSFQLAERVHMKKYCVLCASQFNVNSTVTCAFSASDERDLTSINLLQNRRNLAMFLPLLPGSFCNHQIVKAAGSFQKLK